MRIKAVFFLFVLILANQPVLAADRFVSVTFKPTIDTKYVEVLNAMFGTTTYERMDKYTYRLKIPQLQNPNQYAELFSSLSYVEKTSPAPQYNVSDQISPQIYNVQGIPQKSSSQNKNMVPGEILVKFKANATPEDIQFLNGHHNMTPLGIISGIGVHRLKVTSGMSVEEAIKNYSQSAIVEYAEPNYQVKAFQATSSSPTGVVTEVPMSGGGQVLVDFKPGTADLIPQLFDIIFETRRVEKKGFYSYRLQLPAHMNPNIAVRIFKLSPYVINAQRIYS